MRALRALDLGACFDRDGPSPGDVRVLNNGFLELEEDLVELVMAFRTVRDLDCVRCHRGGDEVLDWRVEDEDTLLIRQAKLGVVLTSLIAQFLNTIAALGGELVLQALELFLLDREVKAHCLILHPYRNLVGDGGHQDVEVGGRAG